MRYYCPGCWNDFWDKDVEVCPACGYNIRAHNDKDYVDKLLNALTHRAGEIRHWAIMVLARKKEKRAIPYLEKLAEESSDPSLAKAAEEALLQINAGT